MKTYWKKPSSYGNPGNNPVYDGPASRTFQQTGGNPGVNPAFNGPARRIVNQRGRPQAPGAWKPTRPQQQRPLTIAERARLRIASIYDPVIKQITDQINAQAKTQQDSIMGYSQNLAGEMGKYVGSFGEIYGNAQKSQAAADAATAQRLEGGGSQLANELSSKLGAIGAPSNVVQQIAGGAASTGTGAANAAYTSGSADLTRLIAQGAAEQSYAAKQPGFVLQRGQQEIFDVGRQASSDIESETGQLRAKIPGDTADYIDQLTADQRDRAEAAAKKKQDKIDRAWEAATLKVAYGIPLTKADKRALQAGYGSNPDAVEVVGKQRQDEAEQSWKSAERRAKETAQAAREAARDARKAQQSASADARRAARDKAKDARTAAREAARDARKARAALEQIRARNKTKKGKGSSGSGPVTADGITGP